MCGIIKLETSKFLNMSNMKSFCTVKTASLVFITLKEKEIKDKKCMHETLIDALQTQYKQAKKDDVTSDELAHMHLATGDQIILYDKDSPNNSIIGTMTKTKNVISWEQETFEQFVPTVDILFQKNMTTYFVFKK
jgi:hypothetical protein